MGFSWRRSLGDSDLRNLQEAYLDLSMYLVSVKSQVSKGDGKRLKELVDVFENPGADVKPRRSPLRCYENYCAFREVLEASGDAKNVLATLRKCAEGDKSAQKDSLEFIEHLIGYCKAA